MSRLVDVDFHVWERAPMVNVEIIDEKIVSYQEVKETLIKYHDRRFKIIEMSQEKDGIPNPMFAMKIIALGVKETPEEEQELVKWVNERRAEK